MGIRHRLLNPRVLVPCAILILLALGIVAGLALRDEPPPSEEGLREVRREVPGTENGFLLLDLRKEDIEWPEDDGSIHASSEDFDPKAAREYVEKNARVLEDFEAALALPDFQTPEVGSVADLVEGSLDFLLAWTRIATLVSSRMRMHLEQGRDAEAFEDVLRLVRFGERIETAQGNLICYLIGLSVRQNAVEQLDRCLRATRLPPERVLPYLEDLKRHPPRPDGLQAAYRVEYGQFATAFDEVPNGNVDALRGEGPRFPGIRTILFKRNQTKRVLGEYLRCVIDLASQDVLLVEHLAPTSACGDVDPRAVPLTNHVGGTILDLLLPTLKRALQGRAEAVLQARALEALYAMRRFEAARDRLPDRLDDLVPMYLDAVPVDPFGGGPLRYSPEKRTLYSIGWDLEDTGGADEGDPDDPWRNPREPTFRLIGDAPPIRG